MLSCIRLGSGEGGKAVQNMEQYRANADPNCTECGGSATPGVVEYHLPDGQRLVAPCVQCFPHDEAAIAAAQFRLRIQARRRDERSSAKGEERKDRGCHANHRTVLSSRRADRSDRRST